MVKTPGGGGCAKMLNSPVFGDEQLHSRQGKNIYYTKTKLQLSRKTRWLTELEISLEPAFELKVESWLSGCTLFSLITCSFRKRDR